MSDSDPIPSTSISDATVGGLSVIVITGGSNGDVLTKQADGTYLPVTPSSGGITGSVGSTTNRLVKSSGTGGSTVQSTGITVDSSDNITGVAAITVSGFVQPSGRYLRLGASAAKYLDMDTVDGVAYWNGSRVQSLGGFLVNGGNELTQYGLEIASGLIRAGTYTFATVPSASSNTGKFLRISDRAQKHAYSDGTNWRFFGDDAIIS